MEKAISNPLPSLRQLTYLVALHDHRHFGRAAAACFVTQSTLSVGLAELERLLGVQLVERSRRSLRFTEIGEEVVARARTTVRMAEDLCAVAQGAREPLAGTVRLAVIPTVAPFLLPGILTAVGPAWPRLKLSVREMLTGAACEALHRGAVDCVLLALPVECGEVELCEIMADRLLLATAEAAGPAGPVSLDRFGDRLLLLEDGHCLRDHVLAACNVAEPSPDAPLVAATLETLVRLVDADLGVTLLPEMAVAGGILAGSNVRGRPLDEADAERRIALAWRKRHPRADEFRLLAGTIRDTVAQPAGSSSEASP